MSEEKKSPTSPQLALDESSGLAVVLTPKQTVSLYKKSKSSGIPFDTLEEVYRRGYSEALSEQVAYDRVNSFIAGGAAIMIDKDLLEKRGLWDNIHAKRERIKHGSGEHMRKPGSKGAPSTKDLKDSQVTEVSAELVGKVNKARTIDKRPSKTEAGAKALQLAVKKAFIGKNVKEAYTNGEPISTNKDDASNRFVGTDSLVQNYKEATPGQSSRLSIIKKVVRESRCTND